MATWLDADYIRKNTEIDASDVDDTDLEFFAEQAQKETLMGINQQVVREKVEYISDARPNDIDGSNKTFYTQNWLGGFFSDSNYDLTVDTDDVKVIKIDSDGTESNLTISSIGITGTSIILETAPSETDTDELYIDYTFSQIDASNPDARLKLAAAYLTASYAYLRLADGGKVDVEFGNVTIKEDYLSSYDKFYQKYESIMEKIETSSVDGGVLYGYSVYSI